MRGIPRTLELGLLVYPVMLLAGGIVLLHYARDSRWDELGVSVAIAFAAVLLVVHISLSWWLRAADQGLLPTVAMLTALGLIMVARLEPALVARQTAWVTLGGFALLVTAIALPRVDWLGRYRYTWLVVGMIGLATTLVFGVDPNGSGMRLWLGYGGLYFQPSEIMKVIMVVFFASYLAEKRLLIAHAPLRLGPVSFPLQYLGPVIAMWVISMGLLIWQRDLGAALLFYLVFLALLYAATGHRYVTIGLGFLLLGGILSYALFDHVELRTRVWLDPWPYAADDAYQIVQGLGAFAAGGISGVGLGFGYPEYVPAVHTDFVLAAAGEELGVLGTLAIIALYLALVHRAFRIALRARSDFAMLLAAGLGATLGLQAAIILAGNLRVMPITGITLPFMSYGGSSILANFVMVGLLLRISAESPDEGNR